MEMPARTDEEIQRDVLEELKRDMLVQPRGVSVSVKDGIVTLTGWVDAYIKKLAVEAAAHRVHGVKAVVNDIEVHLSGSTERTDVDLAQAVLKALRSDPEIPLDQLGVTVSRGWVTLKGKVEYSFQKMNAERLIQNIAGIKGIINLIVVKPHVSPTDLKQNIEKELIRNAEAGASNIKVEVEESKVILHGIVCSYAVKKAAEEVAYAMPGVSEVRNLLVISLP